MAEFKSGEIVFYRNGDRCELGEVKRICDDGYCLVYYSVGDTAAKTPKERLSKIENGAAFEIRRKTEEAA